MDAAATLNTALVPIEPILRKLGAIPLRYGIFAKLRFSHISRHIFFSIASSHTVRLSGQQTFRRGEPDKVFRRFDFAFEMSVFCFDVRNSFRRRMGNAVANKCRVRLGDVIDEVIDCLFKRFGGERLTGEHNNQNRRPPVGGEHCAKAPKVDTSFSQSHHKSLKRQM